MGVVINEKVNHEIKLIWKGFRPSLQMIGAIYRVGVPSIIMQAIGSLMTYGMNLILISFTSTATAVFGVYFKLQSFIFMPIFGLNNGMIPIVAYNYGAGKKERLIKTVKLSVAYAMAVMVIGFLIFQTLPQVLLQWFNASDRMMEIGVPALRIISISFLLAGFCIICGSVFQALGNGVYSMVVSIARQLVVLLPVAFLLSKLGNVNYVWWAFPIAELMSLALSTFFLFRIYHKIIKHIGSQST
jgi:Na+-driven multidrug efflux pump